MEAYEKVVVVAVFLAAIASSGVLVDMSDAQTVCNVTVAGLMACRPAATPPNPPPPTAACCSTLSHADYKCLCSYRNSSLLPSFGIDPNLALQLPDKCKLPHPAHC